MGKYLWELLIQLSPTDLKSVIEAWQQCLANVRHSLFIARWKLRPLKEVIWIKVFSPGMWVFSGDLHLSIKSSETHLD